METKNFWGRLCPKLPRIYTGTMTALLLCAALTLPALATNAAGQDLWTVAQNIIVDVYNHIAGISTALAGLMSAVAVIGVKLSGNQHKSDQAWDWLKRIWVAWAIINGMNLKQLLFGGGAGAPAAEPFRDSIQAWLPIQNIVGGVVVTKDGRFVKILEVLPVNIYLKSPNDRENIISSYAAWLKIAPDDLQIEARTLPADTADYVERMKQYAAHEPNESCREMIEDNIKEIGQGVASDALRHRFFLIFQYESRMRSKGHTTAAIVQRLNEEADTARRYLDGCELEVLEPSFMDDFILKLLYEIINKRTSRRVQLPEGVFDMTTAVHGIYE